MKLLLTSLTLSWRDIIHFYRQRNRVIGALLQPVVFWVLIGSGFNATFRSASGLPYIDYFFVGIILMILLFTSIFSTISVIEDRQAGFLQGVLVAPVPRSSIVLGKVLSGVFLGVFQALLFCLLLFTPMLTLTLSLPGFLALLAAMIAVAFLLTAIGTLLAWSTESTQGYHAIMSVLLFPMWIFSGAAFPVEGTPMWLHSLMMLNPMTHGLALMRACFAETSVALSALTPSLIYVLVAGVTCFALATRKVSRTSQKPMPV